jgi:hypothetical protein
LSWLHIAPGLLDLVELAADLPPIDIVTLDAVICCYACLSALVAAAVATNPAFRFTYPRDVWWMLAFMRLFNLVHEFCRSPARYFAYRQGQMRGLITAAGYTETYDDGSAVGRVVLYSRS